MTWRHFGVVVVSIAILTLRVPSLPGQRPSATPLVALLLEIRVPGWLEDAVPGAEPSTLLPVLRRGDETWVPLIAFCEWAQVPSTACRTETPPDTIIADTLYVPLGRIATLFALHLAVDWNELTLTVDGDSLLPFRQRLRRSARRTALRRRSQRRPDTVSQEGTAPHHPTVVFDYSTTLRDGDRQRGASIADATIRSGTTLFGGIGEETLMMQSPSSGRLTDWSWTRTRPTDGATVLRIGTLPSIGRLPLMRGVIISNTTTFRPSVVDSTRLIVHRAAGWDVDVEQDGMLTASDSADATGTMTLVVPLRYGANTLVLREYAPDGRTIVSRRLIAIPEEQLPPHTTQYAVGIGQSNDAHATPAAMATVRTAPNSMLTLAADTRISQSMRDVGGHVLARVAGASIVSGTIASHECGFDATYAPTPTFEAHETYVHRSTPDPLLAMGLRRVTVRWTPGDMSAGTNTWPTLRGYSETNVLRNRLRRHIRRLSADWSHAGLWGSLILERRLDDGLQRASASLLRGDVNVVVPVSFIPSWTTTAIHAIMFHIGCICVATPDHRLATASASMAMGRGWHVDLQSQWTPVRRAPAMLIGVTQHLGPATVHTVIDRLNRRGHPAVAHTIDGAGVLDVSAHALAWDGSSVISGAGVTGLVYEDENMNNIHDPGEPVVAMADIQVNDQWVRTDAEGHYRVWGLALGAPIHVRLDASIPVDPSWTPTRPEQIVTPRANQYVVVDFSLRPIRGVARP